LAPLNEKQAGVIVQKIAAEILNKGGAPVTRDRLKEIVAEAAKGPDGKSSVNAEEFVNKLVGRSDLLVSWPGNAFGFGHTLGTAYLAGETLINADAGQIATVVANPNWEITIPFAAAKINLGDAVTQRLASMPDLLYTSLFSIVSWLPDAPTNAP